MCTGNYRNCVYTLCECEQGWHSVGKPLTLERDFTGDEMEEYASYLAHVTLVMRHSPDFVLNLFSDVDGEQYLKCIQELTLKSGITFESSYQLLRQKVFDIDLKQEKGKLKRCRLPSGKSIWLCKEHIDKLKVTVLSENVTEAKQKSTNQVWVEAMVEALRVQLNMPFTFRSTVLQRRTYDTTGEDVAEVERHTQMTLSQNTSTLDQTTLKQAIQEVQKEEGAVRQTSEDVKDVKLPNLRQSSKEIQESPPKEGNASRQDSQEVQSPLSKEKRDTRQVTQEVPGSPRKDKEEKPKKKRRKSHKKSKDEATSEINLDITSQVTHNEPGVDSVKKTPDKLPPITQSTVGTPGVVTSGASPTEIGGDNLAPTPSAVTTLDSSVTQETTGQYKDHSKLHSPSSNKNKYTHKPSNQDSAVGSIQSTAQVTPVPNTYNLSTKDAKRTPSTIRGGSSQEDKSASKACVIL
ncbi:uncharacterized protein LOC117323877 [Pecten maximus]|uniref:uncharacterized protein LOC117323877 n=1 Tax=Pecten maximus TaxID=6579 RepID=UPI001458F054|nr:uncharacterized protein LOC117323877 [Pecten maximus]